MRNHADIPRNHVEITIFGQAVNEFSFYVESYNGFELAGFVKIPFDCSGEAVVDIPVYQNQTKVLIKRSNGPDIIRYVEVGKKYFLEYSGLMDEDEWANYYNLN